MNCDLFKALLWGYSEDEVPDSQRGEMEQHAAGCEACGERLEVWSQVTCREVVEFLDDYVSGELSAERLENFDRHMALCPDCVAYLEAYRKTISLAREALPQGPASEPLPEMPEDLIRAIIDANRS